MLKRRWGSATTVNAESREKSYAGVKALSISGLWRLTAGAEPCAAPPYKSSAVYFDDARLPFFRGADATDFAGAESCGGDGERPSSWLA